jgi:hypothetical protein
MGQVASPDIPEFCGSQKRYPGADSSILLSTGKIPEFFLG